MSNFKVIGILTLALFMQKIEWSTSSAIEIVSVRNDREVTTLEPLNCLRKYLAHRFFEVSRARLNVIREPFLSRSRFEYLFLRESNDQFYNPLKITTFAEITLMKKNYLLFLTSKDFVKLRNVSVPKVHHKSFLYVFYEQTDVRISLSDIYSKFTPSFEQNIVLMTFSFRQNATDLSFEWNASRVVLLRCMNSETYEIVKVGQCFKGDNYQRIPFRPINNASCPIQVATINNPPFVSYDPIRGEHNGIEYHLLVLISQQLQAPINFTYINLTVESLIMQESFTSNSISDLNSSQYLRQVKHIFPFI